MRTPPRREARALALEYVRRAELGLEPHPRLAHVGLAELHAAATRVGAAFARAAYFGRHDDRFDPYLTPSLPAALLAHAGRTCHLVSASALERTPAGAVRLQHQVYGSFNALCPEEPFWEQPTVVERRAEAYGSFGYTGYLLDRDKVLTCWHGWEHMAHEEQYAVFDYALAPGRPEPTLLPADRVLAVEPYPLRTAAHESDDERIDTDWVVLRLGTPATHLASIPPPRFGRARRGRAAYALGHPRGLPLKLADHGVVLAVRGRTFRTDLDTCVGNSGSPVFDARTHALVGLVVEGQKDQGDFEPVPARGCYVSNRIDGLVTGQSSVTADAFAPAVTSLLATR